MPTRLPRLLPADIVLTQIKGGGWISNTIERLTRDDPHITFSHAALVLAPLESGQDAILIESTWPRVRQVPLSFYVDGGARWMILRAPGLTAEQREAIVEDALDYEGRWYPLGKLLLQLLDLATGSRFFTRAIGIRLLQVCSGLVARCYRDMAFWSFRDNVTEKALDPESVRPDDIHDHAVRWPTQLQVIAGDLRGG